MLLAGGFFRRDGNRLGEHDLGFGSLLFVEDEVDVQAGAGDAFGAGLDLGEQVGPDPAQDVVIGSEYAQMVALALCTQGLDPRVVLLRRQVLLELGNERKPEGIHVFGGQRSREENGRREERQFYRERGGLSTGRLQAARAGWMALRGAIGYNRAFFAHEFIGAARSKRFT